MTVLKANGTPVKKNRCLFFRCGTRIEPPKQFCAGCEVWIPGYLRHAINGELDAMARGRADADRHWESLLTVAINRGIQMRCLVDKEFKKVIEAEVAEMEAKEKAEAAGLIVPPTAAPGLVVP